MSDESRLMAAVGKADMCELLSRVFSFPDEALASALVEGSFADDCVSCLADAGCLSAAETVERFLVEHDDGLSLQKRMRKEYSLLYLNPARVVIYPYESAFLHMEHGRSGVPALFRTASALDVEAQMLEAGVVAKDGRTEPCDSIFREFEFLSFLYGSLASAIQQEDAEAERLWNDRIVRFLKEHALCWMPLFMERTTEHSADGMYAALARVALVFLGSLADESNR